MSGGLKLSGVVLVEKPVERCLKCNKPTEPRKVELLYHSQSNRSISAYLLTDVLFCIGCSIGFMLKIFQSTVDPYNKRWTVNKQDQVTAAHKTENKKEKPQASIAIDKPKAPISPLITCIYKVVPDHMSQCASCKVLLIKMPVRLLMNTPDKRSSKELQIKGLYCPACHKWMLHESVYMMLQNQNKPYRIEIEPVARTTKAIAKQSPKTKQYMGKEQEKPRKQVATAKQKQRMKSNQYDRYGVFMPGKTSLNRRGYFDE